MDERSKKALEEATRASILEFFNTQVCDNMKSFILGGTNVKRYCKSSSYVVFINNILTLSFIFAYGSLKCDMNSGESISENASSQSSLRIINSLKKAYSQYPVTPELVQFVLTDIQFEMLQDEDSELYDVFKRLSPFSSHDFSLIKYFKLIAEWRVAPARFNMDTLELSVMFYNLLQNIEFLKSYDLVQDEEGNFTFVSKNPFEAEDYQYIPVNYLLYFNEEEYLDMFSLFSVERNDSESGDKLELRYICEKNSQTVSFTVTEDEGDSAENKILRVPEEVYSEISLIPWDNSGSDSKKNNLIHQVHAINYKYIKNLALAISDAIDINIGSKSALFEAFRKRENDELFGNADASQIETQKLDWDSIIVMLLIENSPTSVLETLFLKFEKNFIDIARNLCKRIDNPKMFIRGRNKRELMQEVDTIIKEKLIFGEASGFGKVPNANNRRLKARAQAMLIIASLSAVHEEETVEKSICAGNIYDNMALLEKMKTTMTPEQRCKYVCIILSETFRHIICFYTGLLKYGETKAEFDAKSNIACLSESDIAKDQKSLHESFLDAARSEAEALKSFNASDYNDMRALMQRFIELCEKCGSGANSSESARRSLYSAIGKYELLNTHEFKKHALGYVEGLKKIDESNVNEWISFALRVLEYLRNGTFELSGDNPTRAIYPYTATCNSGNENYEGFKTVTLTLHFDFDGDAAPEKKEIKVLSEFSYDLSNVFYCLPNILRTSNAWWIDPVLINFKDFNEIFVD